LRPRSSSSLRSCRARWPPRRRVSRARCREIGRCCPRPVRSHVEPGSRRQVRLVERQEQLRHRSRQPKARSTSTPLFCAAQHEKADAEPGEVDPARELSIPDDLLCACRLGRRQRLPLGDRTPSQLCQICGWRWRCVSGGILRALVVVSVAG